MYFTKHPELIEDLRALAMAEAQPAEVDTEENGD
jgi:hypothetical protein